MALFKPYSGTSEELDQIVELHPGYVYATTDDGLIHFDTDTNRITVNAKNLVDDDGNIIFADEILTTNDAVDFTNVIISGEGINSATIGTTNTNKGDYSITFGQSNTNTTGQYILAQGYSNTANANYGFTIGQQNTVSHIHGMAIGRGLSTGKTYQAVFGKYNTPTADALLVVGNGSSNSDQKNAFEVLTNGIKIGDTILTEDNLKAILGFIALPTAEEASF